jgi:serine/threonine protein kinase
MELASGTLYQLRQGPRLDEDRIWKYCIQMLLAMEYIHSKNIIHRDIKTLNLMLDANDGIKLGGTHWVASLPHWQTVT